MQVAEVQMFNDCIYFNLTTLTRKITKIWQEEFNKLGLSPSHGYLLFAMQEQPNASQKELAEIMELDASTITRFIDTLINKGFAEKSTRGKGAAFTITPSGTKEYKKIKKTMNLLYEQMESHFGDKAFSQFVDQLYNARQSFKEE